MEIKYSVVYHHAVLKDDVPKLNGSWKKKIKNSIELKLTTAPVLYGKPLRNDLSGAYKLRVGDYRVIYLIKESIVQVVAIQHRSVIYKKSDASIRLH